MRRLRSSSAVTLAVVTLSTSWALAQDARTEASELFHAGRAAYDQRQYGAAALAFEEAYRRVPRGAVAYNAGLSRQLLEDLPRAADDYALALEDATLDLASRDDIRRRLAELDRSVGAVRVTQPAGELVTVGPLKNVKVPALVHLLPGQYEVRLPRKDGPETVATTVVTAGTTSVVSFEPSPPLPPEPEPAPARAGSWMRVLGWTGVGGGVAFSGAAVALGLAAVQARNDFDRSGDTDASLHTRAVTLRTLTNVAWGAAAAVGVTGVVFLILAPRHAPARGAAQPSFELRLGATAAGCALHF